MLTPRHTIVSIAAGVTLAKLSEAAGPQVGMVVVVVVVVVTCAVHDFASKVARLSEAAGPQVGMVVVVISFTVHGLGKPGRRPVSMPTLPHTHPEPQRPCRPEL